ncbi:MAG: hypothetical protein V2J02_09985 [Pseudomonadales bacterium]|jgi:hypothetical protein|nr:hypothetical protein [Pseudomonadales bacterium]
MAALGRASGTIALTGTLLLAAGSASADDGARARLQALADHLAVQASCDRPAAPAMPDGATARPNAMAEAGAAVQAWISATESYLGCLQREQERTPGASPGAASLLMATYGDVVADLAAVTAAWYQEMAAFEAAHGG